MMSTIVLFDVELVAVWRSGHVVGRFSEVTLQYVGPGLY